MTATVHVVPAGAFVTPVPSLTLMWQCNVWFVPTAFVAVAGVIWMFASTNVLCAFGPSPTFASPVVRVSETPPTVTVVEAWIVFVPAVEEVITTSQVPVVPTVVQVLRGRRRRPRDDRDRARRPAPARS